MFAFLKGWKTVVANVLLAILPVLELSEVADVLPYDWLPWYALVVAAANLALRHVSDSPVGYKAPTK